MSRNLNEEKRLYRCVKKYKLIVQQFDKLVEVLNSKAKQPMKRKDPEASSSSGASSSQAVVDNNDDLVKIISRLLQELKAEDDSPTDPAGSTSTGNRK